MPLTRWALRAITHQSVATRTAATRAVATRTVYQPEPCLPERYSARTTATGTAAPESCQQEPLRAGTVFTRTTDR